MKAIKWVGNNILPIWMWFCVVTFAVAIIAPYANAADCSHHSKASRVNPTELSAYQECWLDEHRSDEAHGVLGSIFYVKVAGEYISMPLKDLVIRGKDKAEPYVQLVINERIKEDLIKQAREELEYVRHKLSQAYAKAILLGITAETQEEILYLLETEEELYESLKRSM